VVNGYLLIAQHIDQITGEAFNFGSADSYSVLDLVNLVSLKLNKKLKYRILNTARNEIPYQSLDWSKAKRLLGWMPEYNISDTIGKIYEWYENILES